MLNCFADPVRGAWARPLCRRNRGGFARVIAVASIALAVWLYLLLARGAFWRCSERDDWGATELPAWPRVAAVVPARNEADCVGDSIGSLLAQDYRGAWRLILVDDDSSDGTAEMARRQPPDYLLLTDADIVHAPDSVSRLVAHAEGRRLVLTSLMVKLNCE